MCSEIVYKQQTAYKEKEEIGDRYFLLQETTFMHREKRDAKTEKEEEPGCEDKIFFS